MGTNYYAHFNPCPCCGRGDEPIHVGKSSSGWAFSFRAYNNVWIGPDKEQMTIKTAAAWRELLSRPDVTLLDEYGNKQDVELFWKGVDIKQTNGLFHADKHPSDMNYKDSDGYDFSEYEFS